MEKSIPVADKYIRTARKWIDKLNTGRMTIFNYEPTEEESGITEFELVPIQEDVPCRLSYQDKQSATKDEPAQALKSIRVITALDVDIKEGSILEITFNGVTQKYKQAGRTHINDFRKSTPLEIYEEHAVAEIYEGENE